MNKVTVKELRKPSFSLPFGLVFIGTMCRVPAESESRRQKEEEEEHLADLELDFFSDIKTLVISAINSIDISRYIYS